MRANVLSGIFKNGDENWQLSFDDVAGFLYAKKPGILRAIHGSHCAWIEIEQEPAPEPKK